MEEIKNNTQKKTDEAKQKINQTKEKAQKAQNEYNNFI